MEFLHRSLFTYLRLAFFNWLDVYRDNKVIKRWRKGKDISNRIAGFKVTPSLCTVQLILSEFARDITDRQEISEQTLRYKFTEENKHNRTNISYNLTKEISKRILLLGDIQKQESTDEMYVYIFNYIYKSEPHAIKIYYYHRFMDIFRDDKELMEDYRLEKRKEYLDKVFDEAHKEQIIIEKVKIV